MNFGEFWRFDDFETQRQSDELSRDYEDEPTGSYSYGYDDEIDD